MMSMTCCTRWWLNGVNRLDQSQTITRNKKTLVEKDLVEKNRDTFSFVDPLFELWLKREYGIA